MRVAFRPLRILDQHLGHRQLDSALSVLGSGVARTMGVDWGIVTDHVASAIGAIGGIAGGYTYWRTHRLRAKVKLRATTQGGVKGIRVTVVNKSGFTATVRDVWAFYWKGRLAGRKQADVSASADPRPEFTVDAGGGEFVFFLANNKIDGSLGGIGPATESLSKLKIGVRVSGRNRKVRSRSWQPVD